MNSEPKRKGHTPLLSDTLRTEADARAYLAAKRWPNGVVCAFEGCGGAEVTAFEVKASVRKNGFISFGGKIFTSPSLAGQAATKSVSCNGWQFWTYEQSPGDWVLLETLRK